MTRANTFLIPAFLGCVLSAQTPVSTHYTQIATVPYGASPSVAAQAFDFTSSDDASALLGRLHDDGQKAQGEKTPRAVLEALLKYQPENSFEWVLDQFPGLTSYGRYSVANAMSVLDRQEVYTLLVFLLGNKQEFSPSSRREPFPGQIANIRVCDAAYNSLWILAHGQPGFPSGVPENLQDVDTLAERDSSITAFNNWWQSASSTVLQQKVALSATRPSIATKLQALVSTPLSTATPTLKSRKKTSHARKH